MMNAKKIRAALAALEEGRLLFVHTLTLLSQVGPAVGADVSLKVSFRPPLTGKALAAMKLHMLAVAQNSNARVVKATGGPGPTKPKRPTRVGKKKTVR